MSLFLKYLVTLCKFKTTFWIFERHLPPNFTEDGDHVVTEWSSFQKEEMMKDSEYWTGLTEDTQGRQGTPLSFISGSLEGKTISEALGRPLPCFGD